MAKPSNLKGEATEKLWREALILTEQNEMAMEQWQCNGRVLIEGLDSCGGDRNCYIWLDPDRLNKWIRIGIGLNTNGSKIHLYIVYTNGSWIYLEIIQTDPFVKLQTDPGSKIRLKFNILYIILNSFNQEIVNIFNNFIY